MAFLQINDFASAQNETFALDLGGGTCADWTLVGVEPIPLRRPSRLPLVRAPFRLVFQSRFATVFPQRTYAMSHSRIGSMNIFVTPVGRTPDGIVYEAVFN